MISSLTPLRRAAPTWADQTYAASRSRTAARMAIERSEGSVTVSSRKNVTRLRIFSASLGLCKSMLNGPRTPPKTLMTESTTAWCSAGTSDLPVIGLTRGMVSSFRREESHKIGRERSSSMARRVLFLLCLCVLATAPVSAQEPVRIGVLTIRSGPIASCGRQMEEGLQFALKERGGSLAGRKVEVFFGDSAGQPAQTRAKTLELVERNRVHVLTGPVAAFEAYAISHYENGR